MKAIKLSYQVKMSPVIGTRPLYSYIDCVYRIPHCRTYIFLKSTSHRKPFRHQCGNPIRKNFPPSKLQTDSLKKLTQPIPFKIKITNNTIPIKYVKLLIIQNNYDYYIISSSYVSPIRYKSRITITESAIMFSLYRKQCDAIFLIFFYFS